MSTVSSSHPTEENEITMVSPKTMNLGFRKITIKYSKIKNRKKSIWPWKLDEVFESWRVRAEVTLNDSSHFNSSVETRLSLEKTIELAVLNLTIDVTKARLSRLQKRLAM